jgi:AcrR family transcriptional regulator
VKKRTLGLRAASRRASYHHGNLREALRDAALRLVEKRGPRGLTLRAAARLAGVSQAAPYRHFASKEALLAAVAEEAFRALAQAMRQAGERHPNDPALKFQAYGLAYVTFATSHPSYFRVMFAPEVADKSAYPTLREAAEEAFRLLHDVIAQCQRAGTVKEGDAKELALSAWSIVHGLSALVVDRQLLELYRATVEDIAQSVTQQLFLGLAPRP